MKRLFAGITALLLLLAGTALAETDLSGYAIASGNVTAAEYYDVVAPYSGTLETFDIEAGDRVSEGQEIFHMQENIAFAPENGKIVKWFGKSGDDASAKTALYGGVVAMEPEKEYLINATTQDSYQSNDNRVLHVGEKLYFKTTKASKNEGEGTVVGVSESGYTVEIDKGEFDLKDTFTLYRSGNYAAKDNVGKGTVVRRAPLTIAAKGRVGETFVEEGANVVSGDKLFTILSEDAEPDAKSSITAPAAGVVAKVAANPGQQVWKGMLLARIYKEETLEITAEVDEMDLTKLRVGDRIYYTLDTNAADEEIGEVTEISSLGVPKQNASYYTVKVKIVSRDAKIGQSASIYLPK